MSATAYVLAFIVFGMALSLIIHLRPPAGLVLWTLKLYTGALAAYLVWVAGAVTVFSLLVGSTLAGVVSFLSLLVFASFVRRVTTPYPRLERAFGEDWWKRVPPEQGRNMLTRRWDWKMRYPAAFQEPQVESGLTYAVLPEDGRALTGDLWRPAPGAPHHPLGILFVHGEDQPPNQWLLRYLAAQGYPLLAARIRQAPQTDVYGALGDLKRGVAWMKHNAGEYGVDPQRLVVMGASLGGTFALLHALAPADPDLTPAELRSTDLSVHAAVSFYGSTDLEACFTASGQPGRASAGTPLAPPPGVLTGLERLAGLLDGSPATARAEYTRFSPIHHAHSEAPALMMAQGEQDWLVPVEATREFSRTMRSLGGTVLNVVLPLTDHGFDVVLPELSAPAQSALFYLERFLAVVSEQETGELTVD